MNVGDYVSDFGLRRVCGKGGHEASVPLPEVDRVIVTEYLATDRPGAPATEPLFVVRFKIKGGGWRQERMRDHRVFKLVKTLGKQAGLAQLHPHAFRHACGVELLRRTRGNLRCPGASAPLRHPDHNPVHPVDARRASEGGWCVRQEQGVEKGFSSLHRGTRNRGQKHP